jgi:hypothetical protein
LKRSQQRGSHQKTSANYSASTLLLRLRHAQTAASGSLISASSASTPRAAPDRRAARPAGAGKTFRAFEVLNLGRYERQAYLNVSGRLTGEQKEEALAQKERSSAN